MKNPRVNNETLPETCAENILKKNSKTCTLPFTAKKQRPANLQHSLASSLISDDDYNSVVSVNTVYKTLLELDECLSSSPVTKKNGRIR